MRYLTKEWLHIERLSDTYSRTKISKKAENYDEAYYQKIYRKICDLYIKAERGNELYYDPQEQLKKIDAIIADPDISEKEREKRIRFKQDFIYLNAERIKRGTYFPFDEKIIEQNFSTEIKQRIELYKKLPQEILCKIADLRVFALGYASAEVKKLLKPYCSVQKRISRRWEKIAQRETARAENHLSEKIGINDCTDTPIINIRERKKGIYIDFDLGGRIFIAKGEIVERELKKVYAWDETVPHSGLTMICATELHYIDEKFELHMLLENISEKNKRQLGYLTLRGTNVKEMVTTDEIQKTGKIETICTLDAQPQKCGESGRTGV